MKINQCHFCDSTNVERERYTGWAFWSVLVLSLGLALILIPLLPVTVDCKDCGVMYIAG